MTAVPVDPTKMSDPKGITTVSKRNEHVALLRKTAIDNYVATGGHERDVAGRPVPEIEAATAARRDSVMAQR